MKAKPFIRGLKFGEGVRWRNGRFWYSDFYKHQVSSAGLDGEPRVELTIDDQPSGLGWLPDGRLLVVAMRSQRVLRQEKNGQVVLHADLKGLAKFHANDMLVDRHGNAFIGCFGFDLDKFIEEHGVAALWEGEGPPKAPIICVTPDGKAKIASQGHKFPNGMALIDGGRTLVVAECFIPGLTAFDLNSDGTLSNRRLWAELPRDPFIVPDGICSDAEGAVWCANALGPEVVRVAKGGKILERVETSQNAYCCALGGTDGKSLVVATAPSSNANLISKQLSGILEIATVNVAL